MDQGTHLGKIVTAPVERFHAVLLVALNLLRPRLDMPRGTVAQGKEGHVARSAYQRAGSQTGSIGKEELWVPDPICDLNQLTVLGCVS